MRCRFLEQKLRMATSSPRRLCLNNPNVFCYICGEYTFQSNRKEISKFVKCTYLAYFKVMLGDQDKAWAPGLRSRSRLESEVLGRSRSRTVERTRSRSRSRNILSDSDSSCPISLHINDVNRATYAAACASGVQCSNLFN